MRTWNVGERIWKPPVSPGARGRELFPAVPWVTGALRSARGRPSLAAPARISRWGDRSADPAAGQGHGSTLRGGV